MAVALVFRANSAYPTVAFFRHFWRGFCDSDVSLVGARRVRSGLEQGVEREPQQESEQEK